MTLFAWIDENENLYVAGKDYAGVDRLAARHAEIDEALGVANAYLDEVDTDHDWLRVGRSDLWRFETLWVNPNAFDDENWSDDQWVKVSSYEADRHYDDLGWVPVLTVGLVAA